MSAELNMNPKVKGTLKSTGRKSPNIVRAGKRTLFEDDEGKLFVKIFNKWWQFPNEIEY